MSGLGAIAEPTSRSSDRTKGATERDGADRACENCAERELGGPKPGDLKRQPVDVKIRRSPVH
jgi:hypothetical protein